MPADDKPEPDKSKGDKTFTQDEVDTIVADRLKRERSKYADYDELKAKAQAADKAGDKDKGEVEKLTEQITKLNSDLADERTLRLRTEVAAEKGLTPAHLKRLTGTTREELEENADDLLTDFPLPEKKDDKDAGGEDKGTPPPSRKPRADLKGGTDPTEASTETDPAKLAESVPRL